MHEGLLVLTAVQVNPARGSTGALEARGDLYFRATETMKEAQEIRLSVCLGHGWRGPRLSSLWSLRAG
jgi:hypothetical protein